MTPKQALFTLTHQCADGSSARCGILQTDHGQIETPVFMPVGTLGTVKSLNQEQLADIIRAQIILGNTYHLFLRPGMNILAQAGGLHRFMRWPGPILTDSGGYQVYSLAARRKITEDGVTFASHIDGSKHFFSPEIAMSIQQQIGADVVMAFDECTPYPCDRLYAKKSMELTHRWLDRCIEFMSQNQPHYGYNQILAPIVQGSVYADLRLESAKVISDKGASINAIGGLSVGEPAEVLYEMTHTTAQHLPVNSARYLMGVGTPANILECIGLGIDMFDCVLPTRNARHGMIYTADGIVNIKNKKWATCLDPIDTNSMASSSRSYSRAYLRHLIISKELLGAQLASIQNLAFYTELMRKAREMIAQNRFDTWKTGIIPSLTRRL